MTQCVLVIGGSNFIGPSLIRALKDEDHDVWVLNRGHRLIDGTHQLSADREILSQVEACAKTAPKFFDTVFDLSAQTRAHSEIAWNAFSSRSKHWIHLGSSAVYKERDGDPEPFRETDALGGAFAWGDYGHGKNDAEQFLFEKAKAASITILRPPYVYGPNNNNDRETFIWSRALQGRRVILPGDGQTKIQFIHVDDLAQAFLAASRIEKTPSIAYNIAGPEAVTFGQWVELLADIAGTGSPGVIAGDRLEFLPRQYFPFRDLYCVLNTERISSELHWKPHYNLKSGFTATFASLRPEDLKSRKLDLDIEDQALKIISRTKGSSCAPNL